MYLPQLADRQVVISAPTLANLVDLASRAVDNLERGSGGDALTSELRGTIAEVHARVIIEP